MDLLLPGTKEMPMKTTKSIFGVLKVSLGLTGRICTSSLVPLLSLLLILPVFGAQAAMVFTTLYSFTGTNDGANPAAALVQGSDGNFYGTTYYGGTTNYNAFVIYTGYGTVFKISTNGALTTLYAFGTVTDANGDLLDGAWPNGLVQGRDGYFYGTTYEGGTNNNAVTEPYGCGTVFKISPNGALTSLYSFTGGNDGYWPVAGLVQGSDGYFYGTTPWGGAYADHVGHSCGTVFTISTNGALNTLHSFDGTDGEWPEAALVQVSDGSFYGTTYTGGMNDWGSVFEISTNGVFTSFYSFGCVGSISGLVEGSDGNLYGTSGFVNSNLIGIISYGTVFKISTNGALSTLHSFNGGNDGANPQAGLVQGADGYYYGTTECNGFAYCGMDCHGPVGAGTVFRISTNGALTTLYAFGSTTNASGVALDGANPCGALVQGSDGSFYGTTSSGGTYNNGTVFRLTIVPGLTIIPSGPYVILTWPTNYAGFSYAGFTLQSTTNLGSSAVWSTNSSPPVVIGGQNVVINTISGRQQFYRLSQ
jgi:uncharacterized repeat protein (TIGR03803 family)